MPFTVEEFFAVFARYNAAIGPLPIVAYLAGLVAVALLAVRTRWAAAAILLVLAAMWAINGAGYHWMYFAPINPAARIFAAAFVAEALLLAGVAVFARNLRFAPDPSWRAGLGMALIVYAMAVYPWLGVLFGHLYPAVPLFGVAPCPTTIFTIGVLIMCSWPGWRWLLVVPVIWSAIGGSAAFLLLVPQDYGLAIAGVIAIAVALVGRAREPIRPSS